MLLAGSRNLLADIRRCEDPLRIGHAVILDEYDLDLSFNVRIVVDDVPPHC